MKKRLAIIAAIAAAGWLMRPLTSSEVDMRGETTLTTTVTRSRFLNVPISKRRTVRVDGDLVGEVVGPLDPQGRPHGRWRLTTFTAGRPTDFEEEVYEHGEPLSHR